MNRMRFLLVVVLTLAPQLFAHDPARIARVERGLLPPVVIEGGPTWTIDERLRHYGVPGISVAVIDGGQLVWAKGYGMADVEEGRPVTARTMFLAGSVSKPVSAMAAVDLVERGVVSLDSDINTLLRSWQLPANELTARTPVTLRLLFSHMAGTTVSGFPGYPRTFERPTVTQVLDGSPPTNTSPVRVDVAPGTQFRYSGGGTTVAQQAMVDVTGVDFPTLMRRHVFAPLGMTSSTFAQPLPRSVHSRAATGYRTGPRAIPGGWHVYPEMAAAGLWTTPTDLARVIEEFSDALSGRPTSVLTIDGARLMISPRFRTGPDRHIGIGFFISDRGYFEHAGSDEGFQAFFVATADASKGAVVMGNSDEVFPLISEVVRAIAREYEWPRYLTVAAPRAEPSDDLLARAPGRYRAGPDRVLTIAPRGRSLELRGADGEWMPLYTLADGMLVRTDRDERYRLTETGLEIVTPQGKVSAPRYDGPPLPYELLGEGRLEEALARYRELLAADPNAIDASWIGSLGQTYFRAKKLHVALALSRLDTELRPASARAWSNLAEVLIMMKDHEGAAVALRNSRDRVDADATLNESTRSFLRANADIKLHEIGARKEKGR